MDAISKEKILLKEFIVNKVFERPIGYDISWIFNFKKVSLDKDFLNLYATLTLEHLEEQYPFGFQLGGMEVGAIPLITSISLLSKKKINSFYIRKSRKKTDLTNMIEGEVLPNLSIILLDDIMNRGRTFIKEIIALENLGHKVSQVFSIIRYRPLDFYKDITNKSATIDSIFVFQDFEKLLNINDTFKNGVSNTTNIYPINWKIKLGTPKFKFVLSKSSPALDDQNVYCGSDDGSMNCIDKKSGSTLWKYQIPFLSKNKKAFSNPLLDETSIYFVASDGNLYCLDKKTGKKKWINFEAELMSSSPSLNKNNDLLYIGLESGLLKNSGGAKAKAYADED